MKKIKFKSREVVSKAPEPENKPEIKKEDVKLSYKVYGQDFSLSDADYIDYYRTRMKMMTMRFMLVGRIDDNGVYRIKDEIKYDLISMLKEISDEDEDYIRGEAYFMKKYFYFQIDITRDGLKAKASLYLSEFVDDFLDDEYIVSHIADFEDVDDQHFVNKVKEAYNLKDVALKNDELKIPNLAVLMQDEYDIDKYIGGLYDIASQIYLMRMLKLLEESGDPACLDIIKRYKELSVDIDEQENEEYERRNINKNTRLKALLDRAIDEKGGLDKLNVNKEKLKNIVHEINKSVKAIDGLQKNPAAIEILRPDSPKSSGGGAPKKVAGKAQAKKAGSKGQSSKADKKPSTKSVGKGPAKEEKKKEEKKDKGVAYTGNPYEAIEARRKEEERKKAEEKKRAERETSNRNRDNNADTRDPAVRPNDRRRDESAQGEETASQAEPPAPMLAFAVAELSEEESGLNNAEGSAAANESNENEELENAEGSVSTAEEGQAPERVENVEVPEETPNVVTEVRVSSFVTEINISEVGGTAEQYPDEPEME